MPQDAEGEMNRMAKKGGKGRKRNVGACWSVRIHGHSQNMCMTRKGARFAKKRK